jgi:hypothetical protein
MSFDEKAFEAGIPQSPYSPTTPAQSTTPFDACNGLEAGTPNPTPGRRMVPLDLNIASLTQPDWIKRLGFGEKTHTFPDESPEDRRERKLLAEREISSTDTRSTDKCPNGYPRLASFLSSEANFSVYRGFSYLHSRVLLELQAEIATLERELDELDDVDNESDTQRPRLKSRGFDTKVPRPDDGYRSRQVIFSELRTKLVEYDELLIKARDLQAFQKPSQRDYKSVRTWFWNLKPLVGGEPDYIRKKEDIVTLRTGREWSGFDGFVESTLRRVDCKLVQVGFT